MNQGMDEVLRRLDRLESQLLGRLQLAAMDLQQRQAPPARHFPMSLATVCMITACLGAAATVVTVFALKGSGLL